VNNGLFAFKTYTCSNYIAVINAENNWWGTADAEAIEEMIFHHPDEVKAPTVDYIPCATSAFELTDPTGILEVVAGPLPTDFVLSQNYPNPFNLGTVIEFTLPEPANVEINVYDILGRVVRQVVSGPYSAGTHVVAFDGGDIRNMPLPSGMYLYRITVGEATQTRKMVLLK